MASTDQFEDVEEPVGAGAAPVGRRATALLDDLRGRMGERRRVAVVAAVVLVALLVGFPLAGVSLAQVLVIGLQVGAVYSLIGLGLALVYKSTRVLNFAQGELGTVPAFVAYAIMVGFDWSDNGPHPDRGRLWFATVVAIGVGVLLAVLINRLVVQRLSDANPITSLVATVGVTLFLTSGQLIMFEAKTRPFPRFISGNTRITIGTTHVSWHTVIVLAVLAAAAVLLALFFRTPPGIALLATAQEPFAAELSGVSVSTMSTLAWAAAGALGAIGGILGMGVFERISPGFITATFLIPAFTGAVLGGLTSMIGAVTGGLLLGLVVTYANELVLAQSWKIPGPPQIAVLVVLLAVLLFRPRGLFGQEA